MRELFGGAEADHSGDSLESVEAAKEIIEQCSINRTFVRYVFQSDQRTSDRDQVFVTLGEIVVEKLIEKLSTIVGIGGVHQLAFSSESTTSARCRGSKGFVK